MLPVITWSAAATMSSAAAPAWSMGVEPATLEAARLSSRGPRVWLHPQWQGLPWVQCSPGSAELPGAAMRPRGAQEPSRHCLEGRFDHAAAPLRGPSVEGLNGTWLYTARVSKGQRSGSGSSS